MWLLLILAVIAAGLYYYFQIALKYWTNKGAPQISTSSQLKQNLNIFTKKESISEIIRHTYNTFPNTRYIGMYQLSRPILMIKDPELIKEVAVKSFDHFMDHSTFIPEVCEPLWARNLFALKGQKWKDMRAILSPSFTSSKMRSMFVLISECAENFSKYFLKNKENVTELELKEVFTRFTNDVIATTAFGIKINSLENRDNEFYTMGKRLKFFAGGIKDAVKFLTINASPKLAALLKLSLFEKEVTSFFISLIDETLKVRKEKGIVRPDMIHLLMEAQKGTLVKDETIIDSSFAAQEEHLEGHTPHKEHTEMTNIDIAAQALIFFFAGFETVSSLMCFMAYELAVQPEIQNRLREEIEDTLNECQGNLTYEALLNMKYMDMVVSETLRKWPANVAVDRECVKPYVIQPKLPGEKPIHMEEKSLLWLPMFGIHHDPTYYPDPDKFDPERFSEENKGNIQPYTYLPFGIGPRNCIGSRFALLEAKIVFFHLLQYFDIVPTAKSQIPLKISTATFFLDSQGGFWFGFKKRA